MHILLPVPYGCLANGKLSAASEKALGRALNFWTKSFSGVRPQIYLVLAAFKADPKELELRKKLVCCYLQETGGEIRLIELGSLKDEEELAQRLARELKTRFGTIKTLTVFTEKTHARYIKPVFERRFGSVAGFRVFRCSFEFSHNWICTISSLLIKDFSEMWFLRNLWASFWDWCKAKISRSLRKKLRRLTDVFRL